MIVFLLCLLSHGAPFDVAIDLGPLGADVYPGFTRVHGFGSDDPRVKWTTPPKRSVNRRWPDTLTGDTVSADGVLHLDLPPGVYTLGVQLDEATWTYTPGVGQRMGLRVNGTEVGVEVQPEGRNWLNSKFYAGNPKPNFAKQASAWDRQVAPSQRWRTAVVEVPKGGIDVQAMGGWPAALVAVRGDVAPELEVELALLDATRREHFLEYVLPAYPLHLSEQGPLQIELSAFGDRPDSARAEATVHLARSVAPGQRLALPFFVHGGDSPVTVLVNDASSWSDTAEMVWLDWNVNGVVEPRPALVRPADGAVQGGQGVPPGLVWTHRVPADASPGLHTRTLTLTRADEQVRVDLTLTVRDLQLEEPSAEVGVFVDLRPPVATVFGQGSDDAWEVWDQDVAIMREHGISAVALRFTYDHPKRGVARYGQQLDPSFFTEARRRWREAGGKTVFWLDPYFSVRAPAYITPNGPLLPANGHELIAQYTQSIADMPDTYLMIYDEEVSKYGADFLPRGLAMAEAFRTADSDVQLAAASPHPLTWRPYADPYDVLFMHSTPHYSSEAVRDIQDHGAHPWLYNPPFARESYGIVPWSLGHDGVLQWHVNEARSDPFNDLPRPLQYQLAVLAPGGEEIWPTITLQSLSEGTVDQRYLTTLQALVDELEPKKRSAIQARVRDAKRLLATAQQGVSGRRPRGDTEATFREQDLDALREALAASAEGLARWSKRQRALRATNRAR